MGNWYHRALAGGLYALLFVPLIVSNSLFFPFITGKNFTFRILVEILTALWLLVALRDPSARPRRGALPLVMGVLIVVVLIATLLGIDPYHSWWSNFERMEGAITYLHMVLYFMVLVGTLTTVQSWRRFWNTHLGVSVLIGFIALAQVFGWYEVHQGSFRLDATFGNSAYLAVYMLFSLFITFLLWLNTEHQLLRRYLYPLCVLLQFFVLYKTATRGAILGVLVGLCVTGLILWFRGHEFPYLRRVAQIGIIGVIVIVALFFALRESPLITESPVLSRFASISLTERTTESRLIIWRMSLQGFTERPLFGWGPENYSVVFNKYYDPRLWRSEPWFDRSHNVLIDWLVMTGIAGFLAYVSLYGAGVLGLWSKKSPFSIPERAVLTGLLSAYLIQNLSVFDNLMSLILFIATLAYIHVRSSQTAAPLAERQLLRTVPLWGKGLVVAVLLGSLYYLNVQPLLASRTLIQALSPQETGVSENLKIFEKLFEQKTFAHAEAALQLIAFTQNVFAEPSIPNEFKQTLLRFTATTVEREIERHPTDARLIFLYGTFLSHAGQYERAEVYLERARLLLPRKQAVLIELASLKMGTNRTDEGLELLKQAHELDPKYLEARKIYALSAIALGKTTLANNIMAEVYQSKAVPDKRFALWYANRGDYKRAAEAMEGILKEEGTLSDEDSFMLAGLWVYAGNRAQALTVLADLKKRSSSAASQADQLTAALNAGLNPFTLE